MGSTQGKCFHDSVPSMLVLKIASREERWQGNESESFKQILTESHTVKQLVPLINSPRFSPATKYIIIIIKFMRLLFYLHQLVRQGLCIFSTTPFSLQREEESI